jgi:hypothetical protein
LRQIFKDHGLWELFFLPEAVTKVVARVKITGNSHLVALPIKASLIQGIRLKTTRKT